MIMGIIRKLIFPPKCVGCGEKFNIFAVGYDEKEVYCINCRAEWERTKISPCNTCKKACIDCYCVPDPLNGTVAISLIKFGRSYSSDRLIYALKRRNNERIFDFASSELARRLKTYMWEFKKDGSEMVITHVPRKPSSVSTYGFDHAERLACGISERTGISAVTALKRRRGGKDQKKLDAGDRIKNSLDRFVLIDDAIPLLKDKTVIIVDDVITSGATAAACIQKLRACGACEIIVLSIAKSSIPRKKKDKNKKNPERRKGGSDGVV